MLCITYCKISKASLYVIHVISDHFLCLESRQGSKHMCTVFLIRSKVSITKRTAHLPNLWRPN